jgi:hypothetical protein
MSTIFQTTPLIDSDSHVAEPADLWTSRLASKWADDAPRPEWDEAAGEERWRVGSELLRGVGEYAQAGWNDHPPSPRSMDELAAAGVADEIDGRVLCEDSTGANKIEAAAGK